MPSNAPRRRVRAVAGPRAESDPDRAAGYVGFDEPVGVFTDSLVGHLERGFRSFLEANPGLKDEFYLPVAVSRARQSRRQSCAGQSPAGGWPLVRDDFAEDREITVGVLGDLVDRGVYPEKLWQ